MPTEQTVAVDNYDSRVNTIDSKVITGSRDVPKEDRPFRRKHG